MELRRRVENPQYIESETAGNYTRTEYLSRLTITMFDAEKARLGSKTPPVIWSAGYDVLYEKRAVLKDFMRNIGGAMLACFPVKNVDRTEHCTYWHTGIVFDRAVAGRVAAVFPGRPASGPASGPENSSQATNRRPPDSTA